MNTATMLEIIRPDDWHVHLRDGFYLQRTVSDCARYLSRGLIMPNLTPPITTIEAAKHYQDRILKHIPQYSSFTPLLTLYLTPKTSISDIIKAKQSKLIVGCKLYPAGITTNAESGIFNIEAMYPIFQAMSEQNLVLNIHGESHKENVDIFKREAVFIEKTLLPICQQFPNLRIVLEHISTKNAVDFVLSQNSNIAATITPQHLLFNRNDLLSGGIKPHLYCLPILKTQLDQHALINAAISENPKFFMGTDSAPHSQSAKENACGCAGIYSAHAALEIYAEVFEHYNALDKLEGFTSIYGASFYQLPLNQDKIQLIKSTWKVPKALSFGNENLIPLYANKIINWKVQAL